MEVFNSVTACFWLEIQFETSLWGEKIHGAAFFSSAESIFLPARTFSICDLAIILECFLKLNCVNPFYSCWATVCPHSFILSPSQVLLTQCVWSLIKGVVWCIWSLITNPLLSPFSFQMVTRTKKIFVGGLSANTVVEDVKQYFEQFGKVRPFLFFCFFNYYPAECYHNNYTFISSISLHAAIIITEKTWRRSKACKPILVLTLN